MPGVYKIVCLPTQEFYIGGTTSRLFCIRFSNHRIDLRKGKGPPLLQAAWDRYGEDAFLFMPLEELPREQVAERETTLLHEQSPALNKHHHYGPLARSLGLCVGTVYRRRRKGQDMFEPQKRGRKPKPKVPFIGPKRPVGRPRKTPVV